MSCFGTVTAVNNERNGVMCLFQCLRIFSFSLSLELCSLLAQILDHHLGRPFINCLFEVKRCNAIRFGASVS